MKGALKSKESHAVKAVGYVRVSSQEQVEEGASIPRQVEQIQTYCKLKGLGEPEIIIDQGVSGFKSSREGFQRLQELCRARAIKAVIVYDLSRLSRSVRDTLEFVEDTIGKNGIEFVSLQNDIDTTSPTGKAFLTISAVFNQLYRDEIAHKTREALQHKKKRGEKTGGLVPFGYELIDGCKLIPKKGEAQIVRFMHELRQQGLSLREIIKELESRGIETKTGRKVWHPKIVRQILNRQIDQILHDKGLSDADKDALLPEPLEALYAVKSPKTVTDRTIGDRR